MTNTEMRKIFQSLLAVFPEIKAGMEEILNSWFTTKITISVFESWVIKGRNMIQIAEEFGLSKSRIIGILKNIIRRVRHPYRFKELFKLIPQPLEIDVMRKIEQEHPILLNSPICHLVYEAKEELRKNKLQHLLNIVREIEMDGNAKYLLVLILAEYDEQMNKLAAKVTEIDRRLTDISSFSARDYLQLRENNQTLLNRLKQHEPGILTPEDLK